jgi:hypothetical protein
MKLASATSFSIARAGFMPNAWSTSSRPAPTPNALRKADRPTDWLFYHSFKA